MTDHIVEANKKVIDLDALEKLAARIWSALNDRCHPRFSDMESAVEAMDALISELREARGLLKAANHSQALIIAAAGGQVQITRDLMRESPDDWMLEQRNDFATDRLVVRAFLSKAQGGE